MKWISLGFVAAASVNAFTVPQNVAKGRFVFNAARRQEGPIGRQHGLDRNLRTGGSHFMSMKGAEPVREGDTVVVIGAAGGVGRLVTQSLADTGLYKVRGVVRSLEKAKEVLGEIEGLELVTGNIMEKESLNVAMKDASCVVACTGTTAFPTNRWRGGNTPDAVDNQAVQTMLEVASEGGVLKRFVLLSSVGVERRDKLPFSILNTFGVLDAKAKGEDAVRSTAKEGGFDYVIVRSGRLVGEPFTNPDVAFLTRAENAPTKRAVSVKQGDSETGDVNRGSIAEAFVQAVGHPGAANKSFTVINKVGPSPSESDWSSMFDAL